MKREMLKRLQAETAAELGALLHVILGGLNTEEITWDPEACAARVQATASLDLGNLGLSSFTIQSPGKGMQKGR